MPTFLDFEKPIAELEGKIAKLTVKDVNQALQELIQPKRLVIVKAGDVKKAAEK